MKKALIVVFALLMASIAAVPTAGIAAGPDLRLRPDDGVAGESILVRGRDFSGGASGVVFWESIDEPVGEFTAVDEGDFEVTITVPELPAGDYTVTATAGDESAVDKFTIEVSELESDGAASPPPDWIVNATPTVATSFENLCESGSLNDVPVANAAELTSALADAQPGDRIVLGTGTYTGNFVGEVDGSKSEPIAICGSRQAVIDGGGWEHSGYALHITADYWFVGGITITNAQKGMMLDGSNHSIINRIEVHTVGHEAIHLRTHSSDNIVANNEIHDTGLDNEKFGEGVYVGSAVSNWPKYSDGEPDRSDRNQVLGNRIWNTSSESIDLKEGTEGGLIEGNSFDGSGMTGADSWVDVKGNGYVIRGNTGVNAPQDGFQTHVIDNMEWGTNNLFEQNQATVNAEGVGFYVHQPDSTTNVVRCDNIVEGASAISNLEEPCSE